MRTLPICFLAALCGMAQADFVPGDCIHVTIAAGATSPSQPAVLLIRASPFLVTPLAVGNSFSGDGAYDSFRRAAVVIRATPGGKRVATVNSAGAVADIPYSGNADATLVAPTGDGRIYIQRPGKISCITKSGTTQDLLAVSGSAPFVPTRAYRRMYFDAPSNSLFFGDTAGGNALVIKYPLSTDGSRLAAAPIETMLSTPGLAGVVVVGISSGPSGSLFIKADDNSGGAGPRMLLLNPHTLVPSVSRAAATSALVAKSPAATPRLSAARLSSIHSLTSCACSHSGRPARERSFPTHQSFRWPAAAARTQPCSRSRPPPAPTAQATSTTTAWSTMPISRSSRSATTFSIAPIRPCPRVAQPT